MTAFLGQTSDNTKSIGGHSNTAKHLAESSQPPSGIAVTASYLTEKQYTIAPRYESSVGFS